MNLSTRRSWWLPLLAARAAKAQEIPMVAAGKAGETVFEFIATISQNGGDFSATGYLTAIAGLPESVLFTDPVIRSPQTARFSLSVTATLTARNVMQPMFLLDERGNATVQYSENAGGNPTIIASGPVTLQTSVQVTSPFVGSQSPGKGNFRLTGEIVHAESGSFLLGGVTYQFGAPRIAWIVNGAGDGTLTDPLTPVSMTVVVGNVVAGGRLD